MTLDDELDILHKVPFFGGIDRSRLKLLAFASNRIIFRPGQDLFHEGDEASSAYVILMGTADVVHSTAEGVVKLIQVRKHSIVGEVALLNDQRRTSTVTASSSIESLQLSRDSFQKLVAHCPGTMATILNSLGEQMNEVNKWRSGAPALPGSLR